ncbi:peptide-methionine (R)-S-oxide reductase MsrB [Terrimonas rubra]|uniref:peptide-methionine (R)-S-oxide reductase n=1 Tax=Terrimonas rubra TaxID=1035890 RepID=A0ABW6A5Q5_9BACT
MRLEKIIIFILACSVFQQCSYSQQTPSKIVIKDTMDDKKTNNPVYSNTDTSSVKLSEEEWKKILPANVYQIAREKGTERPWTSPLETLTAKGTYYCAVCGNALFLSDTKFESGCGWPSFYQPVSKTSIIYTPDNSHGMKRVEVQCGRCESHLGHVFEDGPPPTGLRYCINGVVLDFKKAQEIEKNFKKDKDNKSSGKEQ